MDTIRKPFQGVMNIIRFNWHFYLIAFVLSVILILVYLFADDFIRNTIILIVSSLFSVIIISLSVSCYIYDFSDLYTFKWIASTDQNKTIVNIHAGFDETSGIIRDKFICSELTVLDFYDPLKHTEISIKRARKAYPSYPGTISVSSANLPLNDSSADIIFAMLSAHEIRNDEERISFFTELKRIIRPDGRIYVTEHLRDIMNFLAYNIGFLHFHSHKTWLDTFSGAGLEVNHEIKITPFISTFILEKNGASS